MSVIVTGALGFIGANLVRALNKRGISDLWLADHLNDTDKWRNFSGIKFSEYLDRGEFIKRIEDESLPRPDAIFHLGACSSTTETDAGFLLNNNFRFTKTLTEYARRRSVPIILASSAATYGSGSLGYSDSDSVIPELRPLNMYGMSKQLFDMWALKNGLYDDIKGTGVVGLKFFNVYGPLEDHKGSMRSMVWKSYFQIMEEGSVGLFKSSVPDYKDGEQLRDFVYVHDAVKVMLYFFDHPELGGIYNCGTGKARSWNDLAKAVFSAMDKKCRIRYIDMPEKLAGKYQHYTCADISKLRRAGYKDEFTSLEDGVKDYVQNYLQKGCPV